MAVLGLLLSYIRHIKNDLMRVIHHHLVSFGLTVLLSTNACSQADPANGDRWMVVAKGGHLLFAETSETDLTRHVFVVDLGEEDIPAGVPSGFRHVELLADGQYLRAVPDGGKGVWCFTVAVPGSEGCSPGDRAAHVVGISENKAESGWDTSEWLTSTEEAPLLLQNTRR